MQTNINNQALIHFMKMKSKETGFLDRLKIEYRSLICPFTSLIKMVKPGEKVGDIGCGSGQLLLLISEFAQPSYLYGIEIKKKLMENAFSLFKAQPPGSYDFSEYDGNYFPKKIGTLDIIFLVDVLHHVPEKKQADFIKNLVDTIKPGARLVLKDINQGSPLVYFNKLHDFIFNGETGNEINVEKAKTLLLQNGMKIIEERKQTMLVYPHYTLVAKK